MRRLLVWVCLSAGLLGLAPWALASDTHYQDYPLGARSLGLGGAFTALADDPSGLYFNPAGMVDIDQRSIQVTTNLYGLELSDSFFSGLDRALDLNTVVTDLNIIPSSAAGMDVIDKDPDGRPSTVYGLGIFVPSYRNDSARSLTHLDAPIAPHGCNRLAYHHSRQDRTILAILALGHRINPRLSMGISATGVYRNLRDDEETSCFGGDLNQGSYQDFASAQTQLRLVVASVMLSLGFKYELIPNLHLGFVLVSPSRLAFSSASLRIQRGIANSQGRQFEVRDINQMRANTAFGSEIRAGIAYELPGLLLASADLSFHFGQGYRLFKLPAAHQDLQSAITFQSRITREPVLNFNLGTEFKLLDWLTLAGGFFTNFSSAPSIPGALGSLQDRDWLPKVNTYGASLVVGFLDEHTITRVGLNMSYGSGADVVPIYEGLNALGTLPGLVKIKTRRMSAYVFVSSTFRY